MKLIADLHTHTLASDHAYSTIWENTLAAREKGIKILGMTDHGPKMADAPYYYFFNNLKVIPHRVNDVIVLRGCEANILDYDGNMDITDMQMDQLDWVIASFHASICKPAGEEKVLHAWLEIAKNQRVDLIGHCGEEIFRFDYEAGIKAFKEYGKIVEINANSFLVRKGAAKNCAEIARLCKKYEVPVVVDSDAHFCLCIGQVQPAIDMLEEIGFPKTLILNADYDRLYELLLQKSPTGLL